MLTSVYAEYLRLFSNYAILIMENISKAKKRLETRFSVGVFEKAFHDFLAVRGAHILVWL